MGIVEVGLHLTRLTRVASRFIPYDDVGTPNERADEFGEQLTFAKICIVNNKPADEIAAIK